MQYDSDKQEIIIDEEFQMLLPPLEESVFLQLEQTLLQHGIRDPLVLWEGILIDGYNRYTISQTHNLPFNTVSMEFPSRDEVIIWIIENQRNRRNLTLMQHRFYRGLHYHAEKRIITNAEGRNQHTEVDGQSDHQPKTKSTSTRLAAQYNVSPKTIRRDAQLATAILAIGEISPEIKMDILSGKLHISNKQLHELASGTKEDIQELVKQIENGTFVSRAPPGAQDTDDDAKAHDETQTETGPSLDTADMQPWERQFTKMTDEFRSMVRTQSKPDDKKAVKTALRQYISMLENLYKEI